MRSALAFAGLFLWGVFLFGLALLVRAWIWQREGELGLALDDTLLGARVLGAALAAGGAAVAIWRAVAVLRCAGGQRKHTECNVLSRGPRPVAEVLSHRGATDRPMAQGGSPS